MPRKGESHSEESRQRMSDAHKDKPSPALGHVHSAETRRQMSKSLRENHGTAEKEREVVRLHESGMSARDIADKVGRSLGTVRRMLHNQGLEPILKPSGRPRRTP